MDLKGHCLYMTEIQGFTRGSALSQALVLWHPGKGNTPAVTPAHLTSGCVRGGGVMFRELNYHFASFCL